MYPEIAIAIVSASAAWRRSGRLREREPEQHDRRHEEEHGEADHAERAGLHQRAEELVVEDERVRLVADHDPAAEPAAEERPLGDLPQRRLEVGEATRRRPCPPRCTARRPASRRRGTTAPSCRRPSAGPRRRAARCGNAMANRIPATRGWKISVTRNMTPSTTHGRARDRRQHAAEQHHDRAGVHDPAIDGVRRPCRRTSRGRSPAGSAGTGPRRGRSDAAPTRTPGPRRRD